MKQQVLNSKKSFVLGLVTTVVCSATMTSFGTVYYSEDFEGATVGQSITNPPISWNDDASGGANKVGLNLHGDFPGKAASGISAQGSADFWNYTKLVTMPGGGPISLIANAWADSATGVNSGFGWYRTPTHSEMPNWFTIADADSITAGDQPGWSFRTGVPGGVVANTNNFVVGYRGQNVWLGIFANRSLDTLYGQISDGTTYFTTPTFALVTQTGWDSFGLFEDMRTGTATGIDIDNVLIDDTSFSVPEPGTVALLGLGGLLVLRRRNRSGR